MTQRIAIGLTALLWLGACSETGLKGTGRLLDSSETDDANFSYEGLRVDLVPTELPVSADRVTLLPQSVALPTLVSGSPYNAGELSLEAPVELDLQVTAIDRPDLLPAATLPGEAEPIGIAATVRIAEAGTLHDYRGVSGSDGALTMFVMPGDRYQVTIVPDDPRHPLTAFPWDASDPLVLDLEASGSVFGRVLVGDAPLAESWVELIDAAGVRSATATTDRNGFYEIGAAPGAYTLRSLGRPFGEEPVLAFDVDHGDGATRLDVAYPPLDDVLVDARVVDAEGTPLPGITVRFQSLLVDGLESQAASYTADKLTDESGGVLARLPAGTYDVLVLPPARAAGARHTPLRLPAVSFDADADLGLLELDGTADVEGTVADGFETRLPGAVVSCREDGYGERSWSTVTNEEGRFGLQLPQIPVTCAVSPPADRTDLALTRRGFDPAVTPSPTLQLRGGLPVSGTVVRDGEPEGLVVVEIRDGDGQLLGSALTDDEGLWQIQLPSR